MKEKKIVICMVSDIISEYTGGFLKSAIRISNGLDKNKFKIIFLAGKNKSSKKEDYINGMKIYRFPSLPLPRMKGKGCIALPLSRKIREILAKEKVDIVHIQTPLYLSYLAMKVAKNIGLPIVITSHTQPENWLLNVSSINKKYFVDFLYKIFIKIYNKADILICVSDFGKKLLRGHNLKSKIKVISNGIDLSRFKSQSTNDFDKKFGIDHSKNKYVLYVGRLMKEKNIEVLIKSMIYVIKKLPNTRLLIIGEGYREKSLKQLITKLELHTYANFLGFLSEDDLPLVFASCDVFVLPSLIELQGMVLLEAMASGKPIIVANSPDSASPCLVNENGFLFDPYNPSDLAEKIIKILSNDKLRAGMGKKSLRLIKKHDLNFVIKEHEKIYRKLCFAKIK